MAVNYNKLWKLLIDKKMNKSELREAVKTSPNTIAKLGKNEPVSLDVLIRICKKGRMQIEYSNQTADVSSAGSADDHDHSYFGLCNIG